MQPDPRFSALAELLRNDPGRRGVAGLRPWGAKSAAKALRDSAQRLVDGAQRVAIFTGFCIPAVDPPAAETDGPPGALALAHALTMCGKTVDFVTDVYAERLLAAGCSFRALNSVIHVPANIGDGNNLSTSWDALIAIERVGPSHRADTAILGARDPHIAALFEREVPIDHRDRRHNMRGEVIDHHTPPLDGWFEQIKSRRPEAYTLGIGDGGNEIGMGCFPWEQLRTAIQRGPGARIACRIATDEVITCGISNWGAFALVAALGILAASLDVRALLDVDRERELLKQLVNAGAVDGVTLERTPTVDGVSTEDYLNMMKEIASVCSRGL